MNETEINKELEYLDIIKATKIIEYLVYNSLLRQLKIRQKVHISLDISMTLRTEFHIADLLYQYDIEHRIRRVL